MIPEHMRDGLALYINHGIEPGSFLAAVLRNDLFNACGAADDINRHIIFDYVQFLYDHAPRDCWGSKEKVAAWLAQGGLEGKVS